MHAQSRIIASMATVQKIIRKMVRPLRNTVGYWLSGIQSPTADVHEEYVSPLLTLLPVGGALRG